MRDSCFCRLALPNLWLLCTSCLCIFLYICFYLQLYGEAGMEGDKGRDYKKEFFFDYSYWSADPKDGHFIKQEQVKEGIVCLYFWSWLFNQLLMVHSPSGDVVIV